MTEDDAVAELRDGMTVGIGGWGSRRKPMSIIREILRSPVRDLTVVSYGGPDVGMLCAAGKVKKVVYGFVSLDVARDDADILLVTDVGYGKRTKLERFNPQARGGQGVRGIRLMARYPPEFSVLTNILNGSSRSLKNKASLNPRSPTASNSGTVLRMCGAPTNRATPKARNLLPAASTAFS